MKDKVMQGKTLIIGANGKIGRILVSKLANDDSCHVVAMVRDKAACQFDQEIDVVECDLENACKYPMDDCQQVIFTAGSGAHAGFDKTLLVDLWAACKVIDEAKKRKIEHFIMVSSRGADNPDKGPATIKPYLVAKHFADEYLMAEKLNYTILRPGRLIDEAGTGLIKTVRPSDPDKQIISREDTANSVIHCLKNPSAFKKIYEIYKGHQAISTAID